MTKRVIANLLLIIIPLLLLEMIFRVLPVSYPPYILPVSSADPVAHMQLNQDYTYSRGWNFAIRANKHSNNYGYIHKDDYEPSNSSPLLMVVGDSYVEANQVDVGRSTAELLDSGVRGAGRVYSIGLSGAPLSQYLKFAEFSKDIFQPNAMVFVIIGNDFDESLLKYNSSRRFHLFIEKEGDLRLQRVNYELSATKKLLRKSALIRYVMLNLKVKSVIDSHLISSPEKTLEYVGNTKKTVEKQRISDSKKVIDAFLSLLPHKAGLDTGKILFVIDGMRPALYAEDTLMNAENSYFAQMRRYFVNQAISHGYEIIDLQPVFINKYKLDNTRFEFENDGHWNELGHSLVAREIEKSAVYQLVFPREK